MIVQDADLEYDPADWPVLLEPILDGRADACFGSRFLGGPHRVLVLLALGRQPLADDVQQHAHEPEPHRHGDLLQGDARRPRALAGAKLTRANRFGFEPEITARLARADARIFEVPISYSGRTYAEGKKIGWKDGIAAFWHITRFNLFS